MIKCKTRLVDCVLEEGHFFLHKPNPNALLKNDIAEWQEKADNFFDGGAGSDNTESAVVLIEEARTLLLRATLSL